jgi:uncharacterized protein YndB with AHSA1/START domain
MSIEVKVESSIKRTIDEVFEAIVLPEKLKCYFVSKASAPLVEGTTLNWEFADYNVTIKVEVKKVVPNEHIRFEWSASGHSAVVNMYFTAKEDSTKIRITEGLFENSEEGIKKTMQQTQGWTDFICSLKAYLYTGINLRDGKYH